MKKEINFIDLFAGVGGLAYGFYKQGYNCLTTFEINQAALKTYNHNFKSNEKIKDITSEELKLKTQKDFEGKVNLIIGGFPCQGYSMAGKRSVVDPRNQLYKHTIEMIKLNQPDVFVLENVKGILSFKEEDGILVIDKIIQLLKDVGYYSEYILLNAKNFDVPQSRERVIFVGAKDKNKVQEVIKILSEVKKPIPTIYSKIHKFENIKEDFSINHIFPKHTQTMIDNISKLQSNESLYKNYKDAFRRLDYNGISPTVKENHGGVHIHPKLNRCLTPRELATLQSFPEDFIFQGSKSEILKQIGNAVPPNLSIEIAKIINKVFF
ncbi:MAG: DNA cytosine methyltransferase [Mycoplasma sp.]